MNKMLMLTDRQTLSRAGDHPLTGEMLTAIGCCVQVRELTGEMLTAIGCCVQVRELTGEMLTVIRWLARWRSQLRRQTLKPFGALVVTATKHLNVAMVTRLGSIQTTL